MSTPQATTAAKQPNQAALPCTTAVSSALGDQPRVDRATKPLNVMSPDAAPAFRGWIAWDTQVYLAASLPELQRVLESARVRVDPAVRPRSLDLLGHTTADHHLLRLGRTAIDMLDPVVARFFGTLAATGLLPALGIVAVRLLGRETAATEMGHRTMRMLSRTLQLPVYGTLVPLLGNRWDQNGFDGAFGHLLIEASEVS